MEFKQLSKQLASLALLALLFVMVSFSAQHFKAEIMSIIRSGGVIGPATFILLTAIFVVFIIPLDIAFLIPIAAAIWGPVPTALMSITGWTLGAAIAFAIARRFGTGIVEKLIGLKRVYAVERRIPKRNLFGTVILLRILVSVDILSYALGLFSTMPWGQYVLATMIGVAPFGFYFAYAGTLPFWYQIIALVAGVLLTTVILVKYGIEREP